MIRFQQVASFAFVAALMTCAPLQAQDKALIDKGAKLYVAQKCSLCHSIEGKRNAKGVLDGAVSKLKPT